MSGPRGNQVGEIEPGNAALLGVLHNRRRADREIRLENSSTAATSSSSEAR
jgi:hypothetical protein